MDKLRNSLVGMILLIELVLINKNDVNELDRNFLIYVICASNHSSAIEISSNVSMKKPR
jgi:hypothetical protein